MILPPVRVYFDYVDPRSRDLVQRVRAHAGEDSPGATPVLFLPFEVRPPPLPLLPVDAPEWRDRGGPAPLEDPARLGFVPWTRKAHELGEHAREKDSFAAVQSGLFSAYLDAGRDIGRVDVLVAIARDAGLDASEAKAVLDVDRFADRLDQMREEARSLGVTDVPRLVAGDRAVYEPPFTASLLERVLPSD